MLLFAAFIATTGEDLRADASQIEESDDDDDDHVETVPSGAADPNDDLIEDSGSEADDSDAEEDRAPSLYQVFQILGKRAADTLLSANPHGEHEVEGIVGKRLSPLTGEVQYLVRWKHYSSRSDTWESVENLKNSRDAIQEYEALEGDQPVDIVEDPIFHIGKGALWLCPYPPIIETCYNKLFSSDIDGC